ncbi:MULTISPECIES: 16S rRNA (cytosine(1402)-N(4))-methyltransferase RsmH [Kytococcus]|uniref:Ribosomal RNA small subunit methyltransferase H n=1 Tax=Kytococcus schroeteri TaxID=138300 RepID=A0A2I1PAD5_9MICO|nr:MULTISPECIES: 16S rRNA (cytosine(1402)-N(4))-methyltransferase RsmH [Kytococcus]OFS14981.1 16S rRNA (cytosine(1402)-N(4))-methyltransferase [Kytococcus sp. HMSC28H12]PKZ41541.1 16S rRNA (cytosine(1402)-N(4))-methyltransferase RsmH [Kytococcus schroeteri]
MTAEKPTHTRHVPVMLPRILDLLAPALEAADRPVHLDGTLGMGGHAEAVLERFEHVRVVGIDRDPQAIALASERLARFGDRFVAHHGTYDEVPEALALHGVDAAESMLFDLGVSSLQLDEVDRGFSYARNAPLDMRMNPTVGASAADVLNTYEHGELARVLKEYGEERFAGRVASAVLREREVEPFTDSARLVELLERTVPAASQRTGGHPAKRTFQALRIEVNSELSIWATTVHRALDHLAVGGRLAVLSYHSLEDRLTKQALAAGATSSAPPDLPVELPEHAPWLRLVTRGAEQPDEAERAANRRSSSARLRVAERTRTADRPSRRENR